MNRTERDILIDIASRHGKISFRDNNGTVWENAELYYHQNDFHCPEGNLYVELDGFDYDLVNGFSELVVNEVDAEIKNN